MSKHYIDLRSDTVTTPTPEMRSAIAAANVGDDTIDIDPTVVQLQELTAELLGKESAIFMPSGTMTNQVAVRIHCKPGDELLCEAGCHILNYEQAAYAQLSGVAAHAVEGNSGVLHVDQLRNLIRADDEHLVRTRLVCLENTHNRGGGKVQPYQNVVDICQWAHDNGLRTHLDGARLFNAVAASSIEAADWAQHFDTVSICFSKGLGAPVGSALAGTREFITEARRHRKLFGGGMRQAGIIAAGALYALQNNRQRLHEDHRTAQILVKAIRKASRLQLKNETVDTNIVIFCVDKSLCHAGEFVAALKQEGILMFAFGADQIRAVTHLHINEDSARQAAKTILQVAEGFSAGSIKVTEKGASY